MAYTYLDIAGTPSVRAAQEAMGTDHLWVGRELHRDSKRFTPRETQFVAERDSFYMASVSETGWPYVQFRGGPPGFLKVIDDRTLAFADYSGNRQYISLGNFAADARAALILVDYPRRARMKMYARVETVAPDANPTLTAQVTVSAYKAKIERVFLLRLEAFDWNCPQHITPRFTEAQIEEATRSLRERLAQLESENEALRNRSDQM